MNRKASKRLSPDRSTVDATSGSEGSTEFPIGRPAEEWEEAWYPTGWADSRSGARASRGFHFQEVVGAWLASRIAAGIVACDRLVPEGLDDLQLEGPTPVQLEVKSRQGHLGPFPVGLAARHIVKAWSRDVPRFRTSWRLVVTIERGLAGWESAPEDRLTEIPLSQLAAEVDGFDSALAKEVASRKLPSTATEELKANTNLLACSWDDLIEETERHVASIVNLPPAALVVVRRELCSMVAEAVDTNATVDAKDRAGFDRTSLVDEINKIAQLIDLESIDFVLTQGICSPLNRQPTTTGDLYYEGVSTQPSHVSAGLVVPREDLTSQVMDGLGADQAVLLVGPSGVGKSAVLWTLPFAFPGVLWFRVHRISDDDVPHLVRFLQAQKFSAESPIGLLVDAVGGGEMEGWSRLRQTVATLPGVHLVGSARNEDLFSLSTLADCTTVKVSLDETAAETIHRGLTRRSATTTPHWREAFEQSNGLTLEFTHLLTQGTRLNDLVADQIANRIRGGRELELSILALVATADRWSVSIPYQQLEATIVAEPANLRAALETLMDEHLLVERDGMITGIHSVRSRAIMEAMHRMPPPELQTTVVSVLNMLYGSALSRFVYEVLRDEPDLEGPVLQALKKLAHNDVERLMACLRGLELLDFYRQASAWKEIAERHGVPPTHMPFALELATVEIKFPKSFPEHFQNAVSDMIAHPEQSAVRDTLLGMVGIRGLGQELAAATNVETCRRLLKTVGRTTMDCTALLTAAEPGSQLAATLRECSPVDLGDCVSAARDVSPDLARAFVDAVGGTEAVIRRLRGNDPWIRELQVNAADGEMVGVARFLYISESEQGDARERAVGIGRLLLRCLPEITKVDVRAVLPGGYSLKVGGFEHGVSKLLRRHDHTPDTVGWNQLRIRLTRTLLGASETERLHEFATMLSDAAKLVLEFGNAWVRQSENTDEVADLWNRCSALYARGLLLPPKLGSSPFSDEGFGELNDPLASLITEICDKVLPRLDKPGQRAAVMAYINETVLGKLVPASRRQPWQLIGLEDAPSALNELSSALADIGAVLTEFSAGPVSISNIVSTARSGPPYSALFRAAKRSRSKTNRRIRERRTKLIAALESIGMAVDVYWADGDLVRGKESNFAVAIHVNSLYEWEEILTEFVPKIDALRALGENPFMVPILDGKAVPQLAKQLIVGLWPAYDLGEFKDLLSHQLEQRLTKPVIAAHLAMQVLSGLSILSGEGRSVGDLEEFVQRTRNDFKQAVASILDMEQDAVTEALIEWLEEVDEQIAGEFGGNVEAGTFAVNMTEGSFGEWSSESIRLGAAVILSLQWDFDPPSAVALLKELEERSMAESGEP